MQTQKIINHAEANAEAWYAEIVNMLAKLNNIPTGSLAYDREREEAEQTIHESVLSVMVRDGWRIPGTMDGTHEPEEYEILLTTGGPALRIIGQLGQCSEPETAEMQYQDWGTPWTRYPSPSADLIKFAQCFYFGD
jgi:hypothetical protein